MGPASIAIVSSAVISFGRSASGVRVVIRPITGAFTSGCGDRGDEQGGHRRPQRQVEPEEPDRQRQRDDPDRRELERLEPRHQLHRQNHAEQRAGAEGGEQRTRHAGLSLNSSNASTGKAAEKAEPNMFRNTAADRSAGAAGRGAGSGSRRRRRARRRSAAGRSSRERRASASGTRAGRSRRRCEHAQSRRPRRSAARPTTGPSRFVQRRRSLDHAFACATVVSSSPTSSGRITRCESEERRQKQPDQRRRSQGAGKGEHRRRVQEGNRRTSAAHGEIAKVHRAARADLATTAPLGIPSSATGRQLHRENDPHFRRGAGGHQHEPGRARKVIRGPSDRDDLGGDPARRGSGCAGCFTARI